MQWEGPALEDAQGAAVPAVPGDNSADLCSLVFCHPVRVSTVCLLQICLSLSDGLLLQAGPATVLEVGPDGGAAPCGSRLVGKRRRPG